MTCIPEPVREVLSQRSGQVKAKLDELIGRWADENDGAEPDPRTIAGLERAAAVTSRPAKAHGADGTTLHDTWADQARTTGFDPAQLTTRNLPAASREPDRTDEDLIREALYRVTEETSTWLRADVARRLATLLPIHNGAPASDVVARIDHLAARAEQRCRALGSAPPAGMPCRGDGRPVSEHVTDRRFTTPAVLSQELGLQRWAETHTHPTPMTVEDPQSAAVEAMAGSAGLVVVVGPAGTGKTTATARAVYRLGRERRPVVGLAPSGKAADVLAAEAHCDTSTLAGFLTRHTGDRRSPWPAGTTVILDEAGMTATDDLARLATLVHRNRWRLVAVGDPAQLPAVGRGGVFAHWCTTVPRHELAVPRRFDHQWEANASLALRVGDPAAVDAYDGHGRLSAVHPALIARQVVDVYQRYTDEGRSVAVTTNAAETARAVNTEIQRRYDPGARRPARLPLADGTHLSVGDQIATRRNDLHLRTDQGEKVRNRHTWTVTALDPDGAIVGVPPGPRDRHAPRRLRRPPRRARLGRHRLRQSRRHRRHRPRRPRSRHHPQPRLRRPHPRPPTQPRLDPRPHRHPRPRRHPHRHHQPHRRQPLRPRHPHPAPPSRRRDRPRPRIRPERDGPSPGRTRTHRAPRQRTCTARPVARRAHPSDAGAPRPSRATSTRSDRPFAWPMTSTAQHAPVAANRSGPGAQRHRPCLVCPTGEHCGPAPMAPQAPISSIPWIMRSTSRRASTDSPCTLIA